MLENVLKTFLSQNLCFQFYVNIHSYWNSPVWILDTDTRKWEREKKTIIFLNTKGKILLEGNFEILLRWNRIEIFEYYMKSRNKRLKKIKLLCFCSQTKAWKTKKNFSWYFPNIFITRRSWKKLLLMHLKRSDLRGWGWKGFKTYKIYNFLIFNKQTISDVKL